MNKEQDRTEAFDAALSMLGQLCKREDMDVLEKEIAFRFGSANAIFAADRHLNFADTTGNFIHRLHLRRIFINFLGTNRRTDKQTAQSRPTEQNFIHVYLRRLSP